MYNCEIEIANLNLSWKFPFIVSQLPVPGTEAFNYLVRGLQPFGLTARSVSLESPGSNLDDVAIVINLLNYKFTVRLTYSGIDAEGRSIEADEAIQILQVLQIIFESFEKIDAETKNGSGVVRLSLHLKLLEKSVIDYISDRVSVKLKKQNVEPEAVVFPLDFDELTKRLPTKITIAKSVAVENGLFLEIGYQSGKTEQDSQAKEPIDFFQMLSEHYKSLLSFLELNVILEENGDDDFSAK